MTNPPGALPNARGVSSRLGIEPSLVHDPGERHRLANAAPYKHGQWSLHSPLSEELELEDHLRWLLDRLLPVRERILEVVDSDPRLRADFFCVLDLKEEMEGLELSPRTLEGMGLLRAKLSLDLYWEGVREETPEA